MISDFFGSEIAGKILYYLTTPLAYFASHILFLLIGFIIGIRVVLKKANQEQGEEND